jgi:hypothetical protein
MNLSDYLAKINLYTGETLRDECPRCKKDNTFTATNMGSYILYNCYHADCNLSGKIQEGVSKSSFKTPKAPVAKEEFNVNTHFFVDVNRDERAIKYLKSTNSFDAHLENRISVVYDIKQDRVTFLISRDKQVVDACGRKLGKYGSKWHRYGSTKLPFVVQGKQNPKTAVIVEDCSSACAVSCIYSGVALLGTHLTEQSLCDIRQFDEAIICLDKDASMKSIKIAQQIKPHVPVKVKVLETDLKNLSSSEIEEFFNCD